MISLTINNKPVEATENETLLETARRYGIWIPTLCHHEALSAYGGCRLCLVEISDSRGTRIVPSCCHAAAAGLEVRTNTDRLLEIRKFLMELLLAEAPYAKTLQNLARDLGARKPARFEARNELCIACGRCIRACREIVGVSAIDFAERGYDKKAASPFYERSEACIGCGTCAAVCPTGAIECIDLAAGERHTLPDKTKITGPARVIENWNVGLPMQHCSACGEPFAPQFQLEHFKKTASLPADFYDVCTRCRS